MSALTPADIEYMQAHASDDKQTNLYVACAFCIVITIIAVFLRFLARWKVRAWILTDDWLILAAVGPAFGIYLATVFMTYFGMGRHIIFVRSAAGLVQSLVAGICNYSVAIVLTKLSLLALYNRIFPSRALVIISIVTGVVVIIYSIILIIVAVVECVPLASLWTPGEPAVCLNTGLAYTILAAFNVLTDVFILCLPIRYVMQLRLPFAAKVQVLSTFALGACVCVFGIVRTIYVSTAQPQDQSWSTANGAIWSEIEVCVGIVSACLPTYRPLLHTRAPPSIAYNNSSYQHESTNAEGLFEEEPKRSHKSRRIWSTVTTKNTRDESDSSSVVQLREVEGEAPPESKTSLHIPRHSGIHVATQLHQEVTPRTASH